MTSTHPGTQRLIALDALRGFTIVAMIIVNTPGSWSHVYAPLLHARWNGITLTDLVFPLFLFIVGVSISLAFSRLLANGAHKPGLYRKILSRSVKIMLLGFFLSLWPAFEFADMRFAGVLQRISLVYLVCALLYLNSGWKQQVVIGSIILVGYWLLLAVVPVPIDQVIEQALKTGLVAAAHGPIPVGEITTLSEGAIAANYQPGVNMAAWLDRLLLPGSFWEKIWDPEGLISTLPAIVTCIIGMLMGQLLLRKGDSYQKLAWLFFAGFCLYLTGEIWGLVMPFNKNLWSSSYTLWTAGMATMGLAACILIVDVLGMTRWTKPGQVFGANAITAYVLAGILTVLFYQNLFGGHSLAGLWMDGLQAVGFDPRLASFSFAMLYTLMIYIPVRALYTRKIFIKV